MHDARSSILALAVLFTTTGCTMTGDTTPAAGLTDTDWVFETVADRALPDRIRVSMAFDPEEGRVYGSSGCNRYTAGYSLEGDTLIVETAAATKMACPDALMIVEDRFLRLLGDALAVSIDPDTGQLALTGPDGSRSTAFPGAADD